MRRSKLWTGTQSSCEGTVRPSSAASKKAKESRMFPTLSWQRGGRREAQESREPLKTWIEPEMVLDSFRCCTRYGIL